MTSTPAPRSLSLSSRAARRLAPWSLVLALVGAPACATKSFTSAGDAGSTDATAVSDATRDARPGDVSVVETGALKITGDLAFGPVQCGTAAPARTLTIENLGTETFTVTATLGGAAASPYKVKIKGATVAAHQQGTIEVTPQPIPATSPVPGMFNDSLEVRTTLVTDHPHLFPITESAAGAIITFDTDTITFGQVPISSAQSSTFHVLNMGNAPATVQVAVGSPPDPEYSVTQSATTIPGGGSITATVTLSPTTTGTKTSSIVVTPESGSAFCGAMPQPITLTGEGENGGLGISSSALTFGPTPCGTTAMAQSIKLTNSGKASLDWTAALANTSPSPYTVAPTMGTLAAGASTTLTVTPGAIPAMSSIQANFYADTLTLNTDVVGDGPHVIALSQTASGAILAFNPAKVDFGDVPVGQTGMQMLQVVNTGNAGAKVTVSATGTGFSVAPTAVTSVAKMSQTNFTGTFAPGNTTTLHMGGFDVATTDGLCAPLPAMLPASGTGTNGVVAFAPGSLTFGNQPTSGFTACGTQAPAQQVTFTNSGNQSYTVTPTLLGGAASPYTLSMTPTSGVVANGASATITVTPKPIPTTSAVPGSYNDTLSVTTTASGDTVHTISLSESAFGAVLTGAPSTIMFPPTPVAEESSLPVGITNTGNAPAVLVWNNITNPVFTFDQNVTAPPGGVTTSPSAHFEPTMAQPYSASASLGVAMGTILCQAMPATGMALTGTGTNGSVVSVTPAQVNFNMVSCGTSGGMSVVTIKNNSIQSITWSASLPTGAAYTLSNPTSGTLASGASANVTITSNVIPVASTTTTMSNGFGSQLTITTNAPNDTSHVVPILETASGAILAFNPTTLNMPAAMDGTAIPYQVVNTGNVAATVSLALTNPGPAMLTLDMPTSGMTASGMPFVGGVTEAAMSMPSMNATVSLTPAAGTVLCQPAPAPMAITAN